MSNVAGCGCSGEIKNTGYPVNVKTFNYQVGMLIVPLIGSDGTPNKLDLTSSTLGADILARLNNTNAKDRFYYIGDLVNVQAVEGDATFETTPEGARFKLFNGTKNYKAERWGMSNQYFDKVKSMCQDFGLIEIDVCGAIRGELVGTDLFPRKVNKDSYHSMFMDKTTESTSKIMFDFDFKRNTSDGNQWMVTAEELAGIDLTDAKSLVDVNFVINVNSATEIEVFATLDFGTGVEKLPATGIELADLIISNSGVAVTPSASVESATEEGKYTITIPAQTTGDVIDFNVFKAGTQDINGYEGVATTFVAL